MKTYEYTGYVVGRKKLGDGDLILTIYTKQTGKISVVARGIKKPRAKLQSLVEPLVESEYRLVGRGRLPVLVGVKPLAKNNFFMAPMQKNLLALLVTEVLDKLTGEEIVSEDLYLAYRRGLGLLTTFNKDLLATGYTIWAILSASGLEPRIESTDGQKLRLDLINGAVTTEPPEGDSLALHTDTIKIWRAFAQYHWDVLGRISAPQSTLLDSISKLVDYIEYSTHRKIKSFKVLVDTASFESNQAQV